MFDIGFWELSLIGVVALLVIGPERLPGVARSVGQWVGTAKRFVHSVQTDINAEVDKADELKHLLEEQSRVKSLHDILEKTPRGETHRGPVPRAKSDYAVKAVDHDAPPSPLEKSAPAPTDSAASPHKHD
ncbi:MAG: twin-arginine translocase subunit TatB [Gammaproteobacteria bacterium]|nr:twin-arginine translocase subunit TatB [Gammaproteobacteria bacterium]